MVRRSCMLGILRLISIVHFLRTVQPVLIKLGIFISLFFGMCKRYSIASLKLLIFVRVLQASFEPSKIIIRGYL